MIYGGKFMSEKYVVGESNVGVVNCLINFGEVNVLQKFFFAGVL